eukprot:2330291-Pleurochrysis_carterae.AAC.1
MSALKGESAETRRLLKERERVRIEERKRERGRRRAEREVGREGGMRGGRERDGAKTVTGNK